MFEWNWDSVAAECTRFLGPAGYGFVQVSPPQEHIQGSAWWTDYQPVSYTLTSKRGTREQFANMVSTCHDAGLGVIADTVWNHMTAQEYGTGVAGSNFTYYDYPGIYTDEDFHYCNLEPNNVIVNFDNEVEVWTCELGGLADLATDTENVRATLAEYGNDLLSLGVDGLRLDSAKNIDPSDISDILSRLTSQPYVTQEVIWDSGQPVTPDLYAGNGDVQEFRYVTALMNAFLGTDSNISSLEDLDNRGWLNSSDANVFVSNHDTERNGMSLNPYSPSNTYALAHVFSLAHPYGMVTIISSFDGFLNTNAGSPNQSTSNCDDMLTGPNSWFCQHTWGGIAGMVGFRRQVGDAPLQGWVTNSSQQIAFARGSEGFVAINNEDTEWTTTFMTGLPGGPYCDVIDGPPPQESACAGSAYIIGHDGSFAITIGARNAVAVHTGALGSGANVPVGVPFARRAPHTLAAPAIPP